MILDLSNRHCPQCLTVPETVFQNYDVGFPPQRKTEEANMSNSSFARQNQMRFLSVNTHSKDL